MRDMTLRTKLTIGFGSIVLVLLIMAASAYISVSRLAESALRFEHMSHEQKLLLHMEIGVEKKMNGLRGFVITGSEDTLSRYQEGRSEYEQSRDELGGMLITAEAKRLFNDVAVQYGEYSSVQEKTIQLRRAGNFRGASDLLFDPHTTELRAALVKALSAIIDITNRLEEESRNRQRETENTMRVLAIALAAIGLGIGLGVGLLMSRSLLGRIGSMLATIQEVAANNLAIEDVKVTSQDELGQASLALNSMKNNLREIIQSIAGTAEHVASASEQISASATQTANGSETQKDQVHQIATAMQEMSATVHEVSENCNKAAESARQTSDTARQGGVIVEDTLTHMRSIADSVRETAQKVQELGSRSDQIGKIVGVIDDIADQTNLLALNAAIEAARAGEQGRGFAVVADEVRKLAERTTKATKEIAEMIQSVQTETRGAVEKMQSGTQQVEKGVEVTAKAGASLKQIIGQAEHVGEMVTHIATAANEQSSATEQVNSNMEQINRLVAESAEGAQQSAKACEQLSNLAFELQNLVSRFKLASGTGHRQSYRSQYPDRPVGFDALPAPQPAHAGTPSFTPGAAHGSATIDFSSARTKHNAWKTKLRAVLEGRLAMSESEAGSPKDCQLGQWLYSTGLSAYGHIFETHELESTHSQMHASVREVLRAFHAGDRELAQREFQKVSELSSQVITLLTKIEKQVADPGRVRTALALAPRPPVQHSFDHVGQDRIGG